LFSSCRHGILGEIRVSYRSGVYESLFSYFRFVLLQEDRGVPLFRDRGREESHVRCRRSSSIVSRHGILGCRVVPRCEDRCSRLVVTGYSEKFEYRVVPVYTSRCSRIFVSFCCRRIVEDLSFVTGGVKRVTYAVGEIRVSCRVTGYSGVVSIRNIRIRVNGWFVYPSAGCRLFRSKGCLCRGCRCEMSVAPRWGGGEMHRRDTRIWHREVPKVGCADLSE
jgi:hypothetical protein